MPRSQELAWRNCVPHTLRATSKTAKHQKPWGARGAAYVGQSRPGLAVVKERVNGSGAFLVGRFHASAAVHIRERGGHELRIVRL